MEKFVRIIREEGNEGKKSRDVGVGAWANFGSASVVNTHTQNFQT